MKTLSIQIGILTVLGVHATAQVVTPASPVVQAGQTLRFAADRNVTWSLLPGSAGFIATDGTYYAPPSITAPMSLGGCQIGPPDTVFNTRIDELPLHPSSSAWIAAMPAQGITLDPSWGVNLADNTTPSQFFTFNYTPAYDNEPFQLLSWPALKRESGVFSDPVANNDRHVLTVNRQTCQVYEIYNNYPPGTLGSSPPASTYTAQSGWQYNSMSYSLPTGGGTDAAGLPLAPTTLTLDDIRSGIIRHALRVTFANGYISPSFVWPATTNAGAWGTVPYGTRFRLKAGFDISGFSPTARVILTALKNYGMIISDGGSNWDIITATDVTEDRTVQAAIQEIEYANATLNKTQFEIVDESSLMVSPSSARVAYGNSYETPPAFAIVKADDGRDLPVTIPIALQGVALNSPDGGGVWIQSGMTTTLNVFAGGTANTAVTWQMGPALGTLDAAAGTYTAPTVSSPTSTSVTATSVADPTVSVTFPVTVMPPGPIRIAVGDATVYGGPNSHQPDYGPDSLGNMWWRDQAVERGGGVRNDYGYPQSNWPAIPGAYPDIYLYETQYYNGDDTTYRFIVPNGSYNIDYYVAQGDTASCTTNGISGVADPLYYREHLEAQGQIAIHDFYPLATIGAKCYTPAHATIPALVTDNVLYFALRHLSDHTQSGADQFPHTIISAFSVTPVTGTPHLAIDPPSTPPITMSQTVQLYAVGWYMSNSVTWSVTSGPGSVSAGGLYTAPAIPTNGTAVVTATSTVDPSQSASLQMNLTFGTIAVTPGQIDLNRSAVQSFTAAIGNLTYTNVSWSVSPGVGFITTSGVYTAPDTLTHDTTITVTATSNDDPTQTGVAVAVVHLHASPVRVNCGYPVAFTDAQGNIWAGDYGFSGTSNAWSVSVPIANTTPDMYLLYDSGRYSYTDQDFEYDFPLPNGEYTVTLKFADFNFTEPGNYNFDVTINGATVLQNFDPDAVYGMARTAVDRTFVTFVSAKNLNISFLGHQGGALINGIQIIATDTASRRLSGLAALRGTTR